ncbi:NERD domain-containing protein [Dasania sp. GY-MA-18]|uniref:Nuclease-related domain-containing protein n=1 Tax=Dasania phycosphaerae TaxID=2950436 RepID=A0A9J6RLG9_9GAMM|nr:MULTISPECIES: nuclease-related domain-containing protein [Dasania]MCR8923134.1 NERD domain-containing protein [Dasania sp. GY-MA-18]MCZ0865566.1 nuclease-related domain-containing protein [Dasania phycosphaerae]MCZ0869291.1 nuclease-related domain-containing protein [Dasania phycosphaerae]
MEITPITQQLFSTLWYLIPLAITAGILQSPWFKGLFGELQINLLLKLFLSKNKYHLFNNVTLASEDGSTQIDHLLISKYGVFVIETKNMKGWIFGSAYKKTMDSENI